MKLKFTAFLLLFPLLGSFIPGTAFASADWTCDEFTGPNCGEAINDVFMVAPDEAWAVGDYGLILHKVHGDWVHVDSPTTGDLNRIKMATAPGGQTVGWAVGDDITIIYYDGSSWSLAPFVGSLPNNDTSADLFDLDLADAENGWAVGVYGWQNDFNAAIMILKDGVWEDYTDSLYFNDVQMLSATDGWAVGAGGRIMHYDGVSWERVPSPVEVDLFGLDMISANEGWAVGKFGHIMHYINGNWSLQDNSDYAYFYDVDMLSAAEGWTVGNTGHNMHYQNGTWTRRIESTGNLRSVDMLTESNGWAVGEAGQIHHFNGTSWELDTGTAQALNTLQMLSASEGWAMGGDSSPYIQHYDGNNWSTVSYTGGGGAVLDMDMLSASEGWAVGEDGLLLHYQSGNWVQATSPVSATLRGVDMVSASEGWAVGDGVLLHYTGGNWEVYADRTPVFDEELFALDIVAADDAWAVGDRGGILHWDGTNWAMAPSPIYVPGSNWNEIRDVAMVAADDGWATGTAVLYGYLITPVLLRYTGGDWELWAEGGGGDFVEMLSASEGWFGYEDSLLHFQDQNGVPEVSDFLPGYAPQRIYNVHFLSSEEGMGTSYNGTDFLLHYQDGKWYDEQIARHYNLEDVGAVNEDEAWAVGSFSFSPTERKNTILHYTEGKWIDYSKDPPLFDLDMLSASDGWAVGGDERSGAIYHFDGLEWTRALTPTYRLNAVHMLDAGEGWAVGYNGTILHYTATQRTGASTWQEVPSPTPFELYDVFAVAADDVWAVGQNGMVLHFDGAAWSPVASPTTWDIFTIQMISPSEGWASGLHYLNGVWSEGNMPGVYYDLAMLSTNSGWAVGRNSIAYWDGADWTEVQVPFSKRWRGISMVSASEGWIVGEDGLILRYNGSNWGIAGGPMEGDLQAVEMLSADEGWAIGNGSILHFTGGSWQVVVGNRPTEKILFGVDMAPGGAEGWAVGQNGEMLRYRNSKWEKAPSATTNNLNAVAMLSASEGWAVGNTGTILKFNGSNWQYVGGQVTKNLNDLHMNSPTDGWAVGDGATLLHYDGANWNSVTSPTNGDIHSIGMASPNSGWAGIGASFLNYDNGGWQWVYNNAVQLTAHAVHELSKNSAWAVGVGTGDIASFDGSGWAYFPSPTVQTLYGVDFATPARGWAVGEDVILHYLAPGYNFNLFLPLVLR